MKTTTKFAPETRKALVKALAEILETSSKYLGMPSAAYQVGPDYHLAKDGTLTGPDNSDLMAALLERGFAPEAPEAEPTEPDIAAEPASAKPDKTGLPRLYTLRTPRGEIFITEEFATHSEADAEGYGEYFSTALGTIYSYGDNRTFALVTANKAGDWDTTTIGQDFREPAPAEPEAMEIDQVVIEVPLADFTPEALDRLAAMVTAKEALIKKALNVEELPIQILSDRIAFPWFAAVTDGAHIDAYATFITALCKTAREKKRVNAKPPVDGFENESFAMRVWLIGLGLIGPEYKLTRALLGKNLGGNSSWRYGVPEKATPVPAPQEAPAEAPVTEADESAAEAETAGDLPGEEEGENNA